MVVGGWRGMWPEGRCARKRYFAHLLCPGSFSLLSSHSSRHAVCLQFSSSFPQWVVSSALILPSRFLHQPPEAQFFFLTEMMRAGTDKSGLVVQTAYNGSMHTWCNKCTTYYEIHVFCCPWLIHVLLLGLQLYCAEKKIETQELDSCLHHVHKITKFCV